MRYLRYFVILLVIAGSVLSAQTFLSITEDGMYRGRINVSDWEPETRFLRFYNDVGVLFPYLWQGEDSVDYQIEGGVMYVNGKVAGLDLYEAEMMNVEINKICNRRDIQTLLVSDLNFDQIERYPNLTAVSVNGMWFEGDEELDELDFSPLTQLENLRGLFFGAGGISSAQIKVISKCTELRELDFEVCILEPDAMAQVRNLPNLRRLSVASVPDEQMLSLSGHPSLQSITRYWMVFDTLWLEILPTLPNLIELTAIQCEIANPVLEYLAESNQLQSFFCPHAGIYSNKLSYISRMTNLCELDLSGTGVTDDDMHYLSTLVNLEYLNANTADLTSEGVPYISSLTNLKALSMAPHNTDAALDYLQTLQSLEELYLVNSDISAAGLSTLASFTNLKILNLSGTAVSTEDISTLQKALPDCTIIKRF